MASPYSERFIVADALNAWTVWRVPDGKRAVVRQVTGFSPGGGEVFVTIGGIATVSYMALSPGPTAFRAVDLRAVVYAGETVEAYILATGASGVSVHGYLFHDSEGRTAAMTDGEVRAGDPPLGAGV